MNGSDILQIRLHNQRLVGKKFNAPSEAVAWLGAVQAQDYPGAKWGIGQRLQNALDQALDQAFDKGEILRTHVMRPTWHFVHPKDAEWMLRLTWPNINKMMSSYNKKLELTDEIFQKAQKQFVKMLTGNKSITRQELKIGLSKIGIETNVQRLAHIVMQAELDQILISGPIKGKQFTYMLFDERVPKSKVLSHDEALKELAKRYFQSHGPATVHDFSWWSGLNMIDSKKGIEMAKLEKEELDNKIYYYNIPKLIKDSSTIFLLPNYDEYGIAYKNRELFIPKEIREKPQQFGALPYPHMIVYDGMLIGMWKRVFKTNHAEIHANFFKKPSATTLSRLKNAVDEYGKFLSSPVLIN